MGTPTPTPAGAVHFYVDFDNANTFDDIPMSPLGPEAADTLIARDGQLTATSYVPEVPNLPDPEPGSV